jgi:hypothetical protein
MKKTVDTAAELQELRKIPANKKCFDCNQAGTTYAAPELGVFLCSICGGIHREFSHRVKGLSTCNFSEAEVNKLKAAGNEKAAMSWMARHDSRSFPIPDVKDSKKLKEFLRIKYLDKRFYENRQVENKTENKVEEQKVMKKPSGNINLLDDDSSILKPNVPPVSSNPLPNTGFNAFPPGFNAFPAVNPSQVSPSSLPITSSIPVNPLPPTPIPVVSTTPNIQNLFGLPQAGISGNFQPFGNFTGQVFPNGAPGAAGNFFQGQFSQPLQNPGLFAGRNGIQSESGAQLNNPGPSLPVAVSAPPMSGSSTNGLSATGGRHFDPFDFSSPSGAPPTSNSSQPSKDLFEAFNPFASSSSSGGTVNGSSNGSSGFNAFNLPAEYGGSNHVPGFSTGNGNGFNAFTANGMNNVPGNGLVIGSNHPVNHVSFDGNNGSGLAFNPFGIPAGQNNITQNFVSSMGGFGVNTGNPSATFDAFKMNPHTAAPANKFASGPSHFTSKSSDPFEQIMEEQLEKGLTNNSNNPFGNTSQNSLVQKYNQCVETYQRTYGMPFPYSFHEWKNMNPSSSTETEAKQPRENPFDLYG